jgi:hypothetical protein
MHRPPASWESIRRCRRGGVCVVIRDVVVQSGMCVSARWRWTDEGDSVFTTDAAAGFDGEAGPRGRGLNPQATRRAERPKYRRSASVVGVQSNNQPANQHTDGDNAPPTDAYETCCKPQAVASSSRRRRRRTDRFSNPRTMEVQVGRGTAEARPSCQAGVVSRLIKRCGTSPRVQRRARAWCVDSFRAGVRNGKRV